MMELLINTIFLLILFFIIKKKIQELFFHLRLQFKFINDIYNYIYKNISIHNFSVFLFTLFILIFIITLTPNYTLCQDNYMTAEAHSVWFANAQRSQVDFLKNVMDVGTQKKLLVEQLQNRTPGLAIINENLHEIVKSEIALRKDFNIYLDKAAMPSVELRICLDALESSVTTTKVFTDNMANVIAADNANIFKPAEIYDFENLKKLTEGHLDNIKNFRGDYAWSDSGSECDTVSENSSNSGNSRNSGNSSDSGYSSDSGNSSNSGNSSDNYNSSDSGDDS